MVDVREDILARLLVVVTGVPNLRSAQRNNIDLTEDQLPAVIVLDGDEESDGTGDLSQRPPTRPYNVQMTPTINIVEQGDEDGVDITVLRRELIKRVLTDTELNESIVKTGRHGNGVIRYLGCQTDLGWARSLHWALQVQFMIKYTLKPDDL
jgi:hypothetical protein